MYFFILISLFILGAIIGSFLNVVILRYNTGMSLGGRSGCFSCGKKLEWYELVPIVSFLALRGKCRGCKSAISWQYPLVECLTGALFAGLFLARPESYSILFLNMVIWSLLVIITVYDIRHKIIPDGLVFAFSGLALVRLLMTHSTTYLFSYPGILDLLAGPILFVPFFLLWFFSRGTWMGFGDAKLALGMGLFMGLSEGASSVVMGFWIGAIASLAWMGLMKILGKRGPEMKSEIPFAPYLILGMLVVFFFHIDVLGLRFFFGV